VGGGVSGGGVSGAMGNMKFSSIGPLSRGGDIGG